MFRFTWAPRWALKRAGRALGAWSVTCRGVGALGLVRGAEVCGRGAWDYGGTRSLLYGLSVRLPEFPLAVWVVRLSGRMEETGMFLVRPRSFSIHLTILTPFLPEPRTRVRSDHFMVWGVKCH